MAECPSAHLFGWPPEAPGWAGPLPVASPAGGGGAGLGEMRPLMYLQTASSGERMCSRMAQNPPPWAWRTMLEARLDCYRVEGETETQRGDMFTARTFQRSHVETHASNTLCLKRPALEGNNHGWRVPVPQTCHTKGVGCPFSLSAVEAVWTLCDMDT